ncbi:hypothetical protein J5I95_22590 [Candidatus Poribacteria bacterium]|nr:hypothetical protein [Candidatus Poribacteria bacterium]
MPRDTKRSDPKKFTEKSILESLFSAPIVLVSYDGEVVVEEKIEVMDYEHKIDNQEPTDKLNILFAFSLPAYEVVKEGIKFNESVGSLQLKPIRKVKRRPFVVSEYSYKLGNDKDVRIMMRSGHLLSGNQIDCMRYNLFLEIKGAPVLVYKHGILQYSAES